ncbi:MAG: hypothetical protein KY428_08180 [Bacteroidetes bacterium]|nr:hypothetical protein [Bacteroidota bacterium]
MRHLSKYLMLMGLLLLPLLGAAQVVADTVIRETKAAVDTTGKEPLRLQGLRLGIDLKPWIQTLASSERDAYNVHLRLDAGAGDLIRYGALLDITRLETNLQGDSTTYYNKGTAARLGVYLNVIPEDEDQNLVHIGISYGRSWFDESLSGYVKDKDYGDFPINRSSTSLQGGWLELSGGMQARVWKQFYLGYELQLKLFPHFKDNEQVQIYEIPGFGRASRKSAVGFSYFLLYRIPFAK